MLPQARVMWKGAEGTGIYKIFRLEFSKAALPAFLSWHLVNPLISQAANWSNCQNCLWRLKYIQLCIFFLPLGCGSHSRTFLGVIFSHSLGHLDQWQQSREEKSWQRSGFCWLLWWCQVKNIFDVRYAESNLQQRRLSSCSFPGSSCRVTDFTDQRLLPRVLLSLMWGMSR